MPVPIDQGDTLQSHELGVRRCLEGRVAAVIAAGGQGTRLGFDGPKGCYPIGPEGQTLFELLCSRVLAAQLFSGGQIPVAVMTSPLNDQQTREHFFEHHFFGLDPDQVTFVSQALAPLLDEQGDAFAWASGEAAAGPTGNGDVFRCLADAGVIGQWRELGVQSITFSQIDNALVDPVDFNLIGCHAAHECDVTLKTTRRRDADEPVGIVLIEGNRVSIAEYSEVLPSIRGAKDLEGQLLHPLANLSQFCFSLDFFERVAEQTLPKHVASKLVEGVDKQGNARTIRCAKTEYFVFDCLPLARSVSIVESERSKCFAPVKNASGLDSPQTARQLLAELLADSVS